ncbi:MAG: shikimate dehydrogenase family protein [Actinomycetes bacterium]
MEPRTPTSKLVLIGSAASKAMSPALWNPVLAKLGNGWTYGAWDVPADGDLAQVRRKLLDPGVVAANVTMPHKHWAAETADVADESVRLSGACNLLVRAGEMLEAHNTDITAVRKLLGRTHQRHALLLGAGGAARAALISIREQVGTVSITDRDPRASAELLELALELGLDAHALRWEQARDAAPDASLIVNATPIGKNISDLPVWGGAALAPDAVLYDFVYARHITASVACAGAMGIRRIDGWDHLREQAVAMVPLLGLDGKAKTLLQETLVRLRDAH